MFERLLKVRYLAVVVVAFAVIHALAFLYLGGRTALKTYWTILSGKEGGHERPGLELLHALDNLLVSLVMIILAAGVTKLFLTSNPVGHHWSLPKWMDIETFSDLKFLLWETILLALLVFGLSTMFSHEGQTSWNALVIPGAILLLAISLFLMKRGERK
jgi:uncharacterized membrane protein YqhA